jgi:hypothetical protein
MLELKELCTRKSLRYSRATAFSGVEIGLAGLETLCILVTVQDTDMEKKSEFGRGLVYCIGLFLAHAERFRYYDEERRKKYVDRPVSWFNAASDHLFELDTSTIKDRELKRELEEWRDKVLHFGHGFCEPYATKEDVTWSINRANEFLFRIDKDVLCVKAVKAENE